MITDTQQRLIQTEETSKQNTVCLKKCVSRLGEREEKWYKQSQKEIILKNETKSLKRQNTNSHRIKE